MLVAPFRYRASGSPTPLAKRCCLRYAPPVVPAMPVMSMVRPVIRFLPLLPVVALTCNCGTRESAECNCGE